MSIKVIHVVIMGDKWWWWWWWWRIEGPLVVNTGLLWQGGGTKEVLVVPVGSIDQIILERNTGQMETAGSDEGCAKVGLSVQCWLGVSLETARTDKAGEGKGVERVCLLRWLEEGQSAVEVRAERVGSVGVEGSEVNISWRIYHN